MLERAVIRRFYAAPVVAMLGTYAIGLVIRESVRGLHRRPVSFGARAAGRLVQPRDDLELSRWRTRDHRRSPRWSWPRCWLLLTRTSLGLQVRAALENPALARASGISTGRVYAAHLRLRRRAGRARRRPHGADLLAVRRSGRALPDQGLPGRHARRRRQLRGAGARRGADRRAAAPALPWVVSPVVADVLVFVIAIAIVKLRPARPFRHRGGADNDQTNRVERRARSRYPPRCPAAGAPGPPAGRARRRQLDRCRPQGPGRRPDQGRHRHRPDRADQLRRQSPTANVAKMVIERHQRQRRHPRPADRSSILEDTATNESAGRHQRAQAGPAGPGRRRVRRHHQLDAQRHQGHHRQRAARRSTSIRSSTRARSARRTSSAPGPRRRSSATSSSPG